MSLSADKRRVLLAAAASPLRYVQGVGYHRTDVPAAQIVPEPAVRSLANRGLIEGSNILLPDSVHITAAGEAEAKTLRSVLGESTRQLLRQIGEAGELVRRERETTEDEYCQILSTGGAPAETVTMWVAPRRTAPALGYPTEVCHDGDLQDLVDRGLVVLLAGGTRAVLTGAGQWCAGANP